MIRFQKLLPDVEIPRRAHDGDAAFDVFSNEERTLEPGHRQLFKTGLTMWLPPGFVCLILPRSGLAVKHGLTVLNTPGLADPNFRGELGVILINLGQHAYTVERGDRIAQLLVIKFEEANCMEAAPSPPPDSRGTGGFGSTGR